MSVKPSNRWALLLFLVLSLVLPAVALAQPASSRTILKKQVPSDQQYDCRPFGECEPCPKAHRNEPFCQPYGNRRLLHCVPKGTAHHGFHGGTVTAGDGGDHSSLHEKEVPAWESCGKVVLKERQDYWEFVTANLLFFLVGITVLLLRGRKLAMLQYRQLVARIGLPGTGGGEGGQRNRFFSFSL